MVMRGLIRLPLLPLLLLLLPLSPASAADSGGLLRFKSSLADTAGSLQDWNASSYPPCTGDVSNWAGVLCWNGHVWGLQLKRMGLAGQIDLDSLASLRYLRTISFAENAFEGSFPPLNRLPALKSVFLSANRFSGVIPPDAFSGMKYLKKLMLDGNGFGGEIPSSLAALPRLLEVRLDGNQFIGGVPVFRSKSLQLLNVSNNDLSGPIPEAYGRMPTSFFWGNEDLCGDPLEPCFAASPAIPPAQPPDAAIEADRPREQVQPTITTANPKKSSGAKVAIVVLAITLAILAMAFICIVHFRNDRSLKLNSEDSFDIQTKMDGALGVEHIQNPPVTSKNPKKDVQGKLLFVKEHQEKFDLLDLLRASAEVLGSGNFGSSYKAAVGGGQSVVVKRFKLMNGVGREEFHEHMRRLGRLQHKNLLSLVAYYFRKEEKLLVFDFVKNGSLASHLHGAQQGLDWPVRLKIIKGVVRGMAYLYDELPSLMLPHGHLKSSNVLLSESFEPLLMDYGLVPLINLESAQQFMIGYRSPEYAQHRRILRTTDVWSIGILILEVLTGRYPAGHLAHGSGSGNANLVRWVSLIAKEESESSVKNVFDKDMERVSNAKGQMRRLLRIGLAACDEDGKRRWDMGEVAQNVAELKERDCDGE